MASRICHRAIRNWRSFSRWMVTLASGTTMVERMTRMEVAMINSRSVKPPSGLKPRPRWNRENIFIAPLEERGTLRLLHGNRRLRSVDGDGLQSGVTRPALRDGQGSLSAGLRLECYGHDRALSRDAAGTGRPLRRNVQPFFILAMYQGHGLAVLREEAAIGNVHHFQQLVVIIQLYRHGENILCAGNLQVHDESAALRGGDLSRIEQEVGDRRSRVGRGGLSRRRIGRGWRRSLSRSCGRAHVTQRNRVGGADIDRPLVHFADEGPANHVRSDGENGLVLSVVLGFLPKQITNDGNLCKAGNAGQRASLRIVEDAADEARLAVAQADFVL